MIRTKLMRRLTLAGFAPAGRLSHTSCGGLPPWELFVAPLGKLTWGKRACAVLALCAATAIALPAQTFTTLYRFCAQTDCKDGAGAAGLVQATDGNLYGTTGFGGANCAV